MTVVLGDLNLFAVEYLAMKMRANDRAELFGVWPHDDPLRFASEVTYILRNHGSAKIAYIDGKPAALFGFSCHQKPGVYDVWMFGTDQFEKAVFPLMKWCRKEANEILSRTNAHRLQAQSRAEHTEAHKLIRAMGGKQEGDVLRKWGKDGSDYFMFVWINGENDAILRPNYVPTKETA